ncbi:TPA: hypothetical protein N0F65_000921 [Lagenidium giganteum]|uniref:Uncharacterized protein n=1 Tax=Lagenidium giganteum TaxID=4803 RepID=A0AAV2YH88_9STRA|nr:TPA: hypothetical protein N0F65_000921 [Lagenidium giganteum]
MSDEKPAAAASATAATTTTTTAATPVALPLPVLAPVIVEDAPSSQTIFHARLIHPWAPSPESSADATTKNSFFGLELELQAHINAFDGTLNTVTYALQFSTAKNKVQAAHKLSSFGPPFAVLVKSKIAVEATTPEADKKVLKLLAMVQAGNKLIDINSVFFLQSCSTGADVYHQLQRVLDRVSVAKSFDLTFHRHNHAQASAKILPFAMRADVQTAQLAQFAKMAAEEATQPMELKKKKQFVLQQMDFEQEHYLYHHIGSELQKLYGEIMENGQWQAYEFEKALWYYHAPENKLYAEHPMRNNPKTRQVIGYAQIKTRFAARCLQKGVRHSQRRMELANKVVDRVLERVLLDICQDAWNEVWKNEVLPFYVAIAPQLAMYVRNIDEEAEELWVKWQCYHSAGSGSPKAKQLQRQATRQPPRVTFAKPINLTKDSEMDDEDEDEEARWRDYLKLLKNKPKAKQHVQNLSQHANPNMLHRIPPPINTKFELSRQLEARTFQSVAHGSPTNKHVTGSSTLRPSQHAPHKYSNALLPMEQLAMSLAYERAESLDQYSSSTFAPAVSFIQQRDYPVLVRVQRGTRSSSVIAS